MADLICAQGWYGRKTGRGYYIYDKAAPRRANPDVLAIIDDERRVLGITARAFSNQEIVDRCLTAMIAEAVRVIEEGVALRPVDVDAVELFGYGFPRHRGGPMFQADRIGLPVLIDRIERFSREDPQFWRVPELLRRMAQAGKALRR